MPTTKKSYKDPHTQIRNDVLLNLARVKLNKVYYYRFLLVLFRETFGRKRQTGTALGKWMEWQPKIWISHGMAQHKVSSTKKELLALKIIRPNGTKIGFNWHFNQWKCDWYIEPCKLDNKTYPSRQQLTPAGNKKKEQNLPQQVTKLTPAGNKTYPSSEQDTSKSCEYQDSSAPKETKKQRNYIYSLKEEKKKKEKKGPKQTHSYSEQFLEFYALYPRKENKAGSYQVWKRYFEKEKCFTPEGIALMVQNYKRDQWKDREMKYIPLCSTWLNRRPWEDGAAHAEKGDSPLNYGAEMYLMTLGQEKQDWKFKLESGYYEDDECRKEIEAIEKEEMLVRKIGRKPDNPRKPAW